MEPQTRPRARDDRLVVRELPDEVLVYDLESHAAHCLNHTAALVWQHCDGERTVADIATALEPELGEVDDEVVWLALEELWKRELLQGEPEEGSGISRATLLKRVGVGAAAFSLPAIASLAAPTAAHAVSCLQQGAGCTGVVTPCCPGTACIGGTCQPCLFQESPCSLTGGLPCCPPTTCKGGSCSF